MNEYHHNFVEKLEKKGKKIIFSIYSFNTDLTH